MKIPIIIAATGLLLILVKLAFTTGRRLPRHRVRRMRIRLRLRLHPGKGHASIIELWWRWGRFAAFRHARHTRPALSFTRLLLTPVAEYSILAGRAQRRHRLHLPLDEHAVIFSPPRGGKTGWLARVILHYPGPVVSTTTKHDVFALTSTVRAHRGPVHVFNPQGIGDILSTFQWNPLEGCQEPAAAIRRADAFANSVSQKGVEDSSFWAAKASDYLRAYFHAAALAGLDLRAVARWVSGLGLEEPEDILRTTPGAAQHMADQLAEMRGEANKTISTVRMTMSRALAFLADTQLAAAVLPGEGRSLDLRAFLRETGTLYLIAETRGEDSPLAPLFACLTSEIHYTAALTGSLSDSGRLDPPLLLALDEVTQICPVPVPSWLADSGGKGIQIITVAHGEAQLRGRWGANGARVIMDTSGTKIWLPGISDPTTLEDASRLCGTTAMRESRIGPSRRHDHHDYYTRHPIMTPDMIRQLPPRYALLIRGAMSPVIAHLPMAWHDRTYKTTRRHRTTGAMRRPAHQPATVNGQPATPPRPVPSPNGPWPTWEDTDPGLASPAPWEENPGHYPWQ